MSGRFLKRTPLAEAVEILTAGTAKVPSEVVRTEHASGRIAAESTTARHASPHYRASAMDGFAVRAAETFAAADAPVVLRCLDKPARPGTGAESPDALACLPVDTGDPIPDWADAVVRVENTKTAPGGIAVTQPSVPGKDIRRIGEDIDAQTRIIARGARIRPQDIGALLATGSADLRVMRPVSIAAVATGGEIIEPGGAPQSGRVIEFNARVLASMAEDWNATCTYLGGTGDDRDALSKQIVAAAQHHDLVCVIAGSSAGSKDFTVDVMTELGDLLFHGVDIMPGRPVAAALVGGTPVIAIPGYPVSAYIVYRELIAPLVATKLGTAPPAPERLNVEIRRKIPSRLGTEEFLRVLIRWDGETAIAAPLPRGAGSIGSVAEADALLRIAPNCEGIEPGVTVAVELLRPLAETRASLVAAGPPCSIGAAMEDSARDEDPRRRIGNLSAPDQDAITALACGEADFALLVTDDDATLDGWRRTATDKLGSNVQLQVTGSDESPRTLFIAHTETGRQPGLSPAQLFQRVV